MLQSVLRGKAQQAYSALSIDDAAKYDVVKKAILTAYELVPEAYRQKFRGLRRNDNQTHVEFAHDKEVYFERWCTSRSVGDDFKLLKDLMLVKEFKRCVKDDIKSYLDGKDVKTLHEAAKLADEYSLTHKSKYGAQDRQSTSKKNGGNPVAAHTTDVKVKTTENKTKRDDAKKEAFSTLTCYYCKKPGHVLSECLHLKKKREREASASGNALVASLREKPVNVGSMEPSCPFDIINCESSDLLRKDFLPFVSEGFVSLSENSTPQPIRILRDTGASQSLLLRCALSSCNGDDTATGDFTLVQGIEGRIVTVPLHSVFLKSDLVTGRVKVGLMANLPIKGICLLLGNDLAGGKVVPSMCLTAKPSMEEESNVDSNVFPSCAVTRAMARKAEEKEGQVQSSTVLNQDVEKLGRQIDTDENDCPDEVSDTLLETLFEQDRDSSPVKVTEDPHVSDALSLSRQLIMEQSNDAEIAKLREDALSEDEIARVPVGYYLKDKVLMRKWHPPDIPASEDWAVVHQVIVPKAYRNDILSMGHCLPLGGHLGVNKTVNKIIKQFFWSGLRKDVANFCRTCHSCQMVGKHQSDPPVAPLKPIPSFGEPFSKVIVDCVGPLPRTRSGNEYMLTIMCAATRFPEAIPLRNIKAATVSKALIKCFTVFGLPKEIQSDQGSNFTSGLFQQVVYELGIKQITSSAYHPESQGSLERFHSTLKTMIRAYCFENEKDWDEGVHLLLFAARESVQESLGISPFELVFGHQVRGPLALLCEQWTYKDKHVNLLDYVLNFKERLYGACALAREKLKSTQRKMKTWYDRKARERTFSPGDKVLVVFPMQSNPLQARFHGPYVIHSKVSDLNYLVSTLDRRKTRQLCHINMLKPYHNRPMKVVSVVHQPIVESSGEDKDWQDEEPR
uniref:Gypsy retrotransposon integrase-like protein 1 n=1 Tax=Takifugu rubripes TaxID=31033 RepID=A0A3B5K222_TAKRU|eukprot:XP_011614612.1 PREDICTED: uncharacterized protein LOC105418111 [Takifugu rubripes]